MPEIVEKLGVLLAPILEAHDAFQVELALRGERGGKIVQAFVDTDKGITIEECALISREFGQEIDREELIQGAYRLEISSPGIDKPIRLLRQYKKNIGRTYKVVHASADARATLVGKLINVEGDLLTFELDGGSATTLAFGNIIESKEELPW